MRLRLLVILVSFSEELPGEQLNVRDVAADLVHVVVLLCLFVVELVNRGGTYVLLTDYAWKYIT